MSKAAKGLSLFEKARAKAKKGAKALKELERGISTRAGGKKAQGVEIIKGTKTRDLGKGFGLKQTGVDKSGKKVGSRMAERGQKAAVVSSGRKRIGAGAAGAAAVGTGIGVSRGGKDKTKEDTKTTTGAGKKTTTGKTTTTAKKDDGKKTFRERRLARMKKRLEGAENEGRKRRLTRRIGRVEGRIEDAKERKAKKKNMGGMMKSKGMAKGGAMKKKGYSKGGPVKKNTGKQTHPSAYEAAEKRAKDKKPVPEENKGLKKLPKDVRNKMGYMKGGGMAKKGYAKGGSVKKKGYSKGGAVKKKGGARGGKPRGVGAALRGYGKAMR